MHSREPSILQMHTAYIKKKKKKDGADHLIFIQLCNQNTQKAPSNNTN